MLKKLAGSIRQYKKATLLTPFFVALEVTMEVIIPLLMAQLIDYGIDAGNMNYVVKMGGALLLAALISLAFGLLAGRTAAVASAGFAQNLRKDMFYKVQSFSFSNIDKFSTASIVTRLTTDVTNVQNSFQMLTRMAIRSPIMLFFALFVSFSIDQKLSLIFLGSIPILGVGLWLIMSNVHPIFARVFRTYDKLNNVVQENLRGMRVVKSFVREDFETRKFMDISKSIYKDFSKAERLLVFNMPLMQFCMYACILFVSWFGARAIVASGGDPVTGLSTGELLSLITYATQILMSLMMLSMVFVMLTISRASATRIVELLEEESNLQNRDHPVSQVRNGDISFENVSFSYSKDADKPVLDRINLDIRAGETLGILGGTGSSKSTLVQLIPRLYDVTEGKVKVGGVDVRDYDLETLRNQVAMVLQKNVLFSGTIKENLRWGNEQATEEEMVQACKLAHAHDFIAGFPNQYNTLIEQGGVNLSGGQKQRLCIARALLKSPQILILDDSTSAVDMETDAQIRKALAEHLPDTTKLIIAQRVSSVQDADRIIVMDDGKIMAVGSHEELLQTSEIYREVYESQAKGGDEG
ncbi:ABC transporter ATP-binding protein [Desulfitobacterium chlororespirans]|uniref:ATP-binding cassette, subfamily B n=1 Tax=Desulfitobacterium chlororespirans DSM 11544 TaxID=1121395 RepID=A0A1M7TXD3_9FIRM|nr:ABC transporter ATP-binding protein [Desulfitobacterium chlororespirans]SHN75378.1 ATP-binding cassette, subfamily B [Desulfitobacterium chlororespirans DSM 11544]